MSSFIKKTDEPEPSCSMLTDREKDRQTEVTNLKAAFRNFAKMPKTVFFQFLYRVSYP
jgi:hypothetical protein